MPTDPDSAQEAHVPAHAVEQQTLWAQKPELHMALAVQGAVMGSLPQLMLTQLFGDAQSAVVLHVALQVGVAVSHR